MIIRLTTPPPTNNCYDFCDLFRGHANLMYKTTERSLHAMHDLSEGGLFSESLANHRMFSQES